MESEKKSLPIGAIIIAILLILYISLQIFGGLIQLAFLKSLDVSGIIGILVSLVIIFGILTQQKWLPSFVKFWQILLILFSIGSLLWIFINPFFGVAAIAVIPEPVRQMFEISTFDYNKLIFQAIVHIVFNLIPLIIVSIILIWYFSLRKEYFYK